MVSSVSFCDCAKTAFGAKVIIRNVLRTQMTNLLFLIIPSPKAIYKKNYPYSLFFDLYLNTPRRKLGGSFHKASHDMPPPANAEVTDRIPLILDLGKSDIMSIYYL